MRKSWLVWVLERIRRRIPALMVMVGAQIGYSLFLVLFAIGSSGVIDSAAAGDVQAFKVAGLRQLCIILGGMACQFVLRHLHERLRIDLDRDWKKRLLHGLLHGDFAQVRHYHSAELLNRMNNDVTQVNEGVLTILPGTAAMITRLAAAVTVLGVLDLRFTLLLAVFGSVLLVGTAFLRKRLKELNKRVSEQNGKVSGFLQEIMEKLLMVQAMDVAQEVEIRADELLDQRNKVQRRRKNISLWTHTGFSLTYYGVGFFALIWCGFKLLEGQMSFGALMAVIQLVNQLQTPFVNLSGVLPQYAAMAASAERLMELERIKGVEDTLAEDPASLYARMTEIKAKGLYFAYDKEWILDNADFAMPKGSFAAITGTSGNGKSTLLKLLLGIYPTASGQMWLQMGENSLEISRRARKLFAYVPQGNLLLSGTLRENLTLANPDATEGEIANALYVSAMDDFVGELPRGLDTVLGENGMGLSDGQAQRLAIARALVTHAPILLLDECTSALDEATELKVLTRLKNLPDKTCIAVTHRPAALKLCDWQLEVAEGKIKAIQMH